MVHSSLPHGFRRVTAAVGCAQQRGASAEQVSRLLVRRGPELVVYAMRPPTPAARQAFAQCIYLIEQNRWTSWTGYDTKSVG